VLAVRWYLRFGLSYRDVEELLAERGIDVDHVSAHRWVRRFAQLLADAARFGRHRVGDRWHVDETYAYQMLTAMGMEAFAERARRELRATGEAVRKRTSETLTDLTSQEAQIAKLARDGRTNQEIGSQLFISPRTVEWHLGNLFTKLGITSRKGLR